MEIVRGEEQNKHPHKHTASTEGVYNDDVIKEYNKFRKITSLNDVGALLRAPEHTKYLTAPKQTASTFESQKKRPSLLPQKKNEIWENAIFRMRARSASFWPTK